VIGADGLRSAVATKVEAPIYEQGRHAAGVVYAFWPGLGNGGNRWHYRPGVSAGVIPTNGGENCVFAAMPGARFLGEIHADMEAGYRRVLAECAPPLAEALSAASPPDRLRGFPGHPGQMRQSHGPGWALVGDAGYFKDPITAHGISDALRDAEFLARAVERGTDGALAGYQATRDGLSRELFEITDAIAGFAWDLDELKVLHKRLSTAMNHEVEALLGLDGPAESPAAVADGSPKHASRPRD
jgi:2-polyprenyl-6-methoxyphenol hydroxylase-like FAD-dependent oxidoreductase